MCQAVTSSLFYTWLIISLPIFWEIWSGPIRTRHIIVCLVSRDILQNNLSMTFDKDNAYRSNWCIDCTASKYLIQPYGNMS